MAPNSNEGSLKISSPRAVYRAVATHYVKSIWQSWSFQVVEQGCRAHGKGLTGTIQRQIQTENVASSGGAYEMR